MDLGKCKVRKNRCDILNCALHPNHGLVWTDGRTIYLCPVHITDGQLNPAEFKKLGQFEHVSSLHWSCALHCSSLTSDENSKSTQSTPSEIFCYLCVVHKDTVSLWRVTGQTPTLSLKQVRKINASPLPQGCLWHPSTDVLCILTKDKGSFYFQHTQKKGSYALPPLESGTISCGCWSHDGKKLLLGLGSIVLVYHWADIEKSVSDYTIIAWKIPRVEGTLLCMSAFTNDTYICTTDLPLDKLCQGSKDMFQVPAITNESKDDAIAEQVNGVSSHTEALLSLKPAEENVQSCAQMVMFEVQSGSLSIEPRKLCSYDVIGVLSLDLLLCQETTYTVVVGSNARSTLQAFCIEDNAFVKKADLLLGDDERPRGICSAIATRSNNLSNQNLGHASHGHCDGVLVATAKCNKNPTLVAFPSSALFEETQLTLKYMEVPGKKTNVFSHNSKDLPNNKMFREIQLPDGNSKVHLLRISPLRTPGVHGGTRHDENSQTEVHSNKSYSSSTSSRSLNEMDEVIPITSRPLPTPPEQFRSKADSSNDDPLSSYKELSTELTPGNILKQAKCDFDKVVFEPPKEGIVPSRRLPRTPERHCDSPEFNLVLPNSHSNFVGFDSDHNQNTAKSKILLLDGSEFKGSAELQTERTNFDEKGPTFVNSLSSYFEGGDTVNAMYDKISIDEDVNKEMYCEDRKSTVGSQAPKRTCEECIASCGSKTKTVMSREVLELQEVVKSQGEQIAELKDRIENSSRDVNTNQQRTSYSSFSCPDLITLIHKRDDQQEVRKTFLLEQKRLKLETVKRAFGVSLLELSSGKSSFVVSSNNDGYIPLLFDCHCDVYVSDASHR